ncbi:Hypothetical protein NTJ_08105 [Nesidiocoris tenuis]|uniref:Uncharacterized protein n=1 Tax=Nesidiocoris tenuis TaxID=355587 RepID=A0ABN7AWQ4_9HEMI|nr:Hypothetical protein NTJ_08105 [Nesidiocoris tenuis]
MENSADGESCHQQSRLERGDWEPQQQRADRVEAPQQYIASNRILQDYRSIQRVAVNVGFQNQRRRRNNDFGCPSATRWIFILSILMSGTLLVFVFGFMFVEIFKQIHVPRPTMAPKFI